MKIRIDASDDFFSFLTENYGNEFSLVSKQEIEGDNALNAAITAVAGSIIVSFLVNLASNFVYTAICNYYKTHPREPLKIITKNGIKMITPNNINDEEIKAFLNEII